MKKTNFKGKILIIVENLPVPFDSRVWQEAKTLTENGYMVSVISPKGKGYMKDEEIIDGVYIYRHDLPADKEGFLNYIREYTQALFSEMRLAKHIYRTRGFDVIHGCNPPDDIFLIARPFKKYGVKYVFDHHDICPELFEAKYNKKRGILYRLLLYFEKQNYKNADFAFVTNESYREIAIKRAKMKPEKLMVLRSGPSLDRMKIASPNMELKRGYKYMVGYLGVIGKQEGIEYILKCARYIKDRDNNVCFAIVGGGPYLSKMQEEAEILGVADCVIFTGRVSDELMLKYLNTADICVNSDSYNSMNDKSTMNKILEYMALAKPIVQFDLAEGRYSAGEASLYAKPNDYVDMAEKIMELLNNPEKRKIMGEYGRSRIVNELSWEHTSRALIEGYEKVFKT